MRNPYGGLRRYEAVVEYATDDALLTSPLSPDTGQETASTSVSEQSATETSSSQVTELDCDVSDARAMAGEGPTQGNLEMSLDWDDLDWLDGWSDAFQPTTDLNSTTISKSIKTVALSGSTPSQGQLLSSAFFQGPIDLPTTLVEYWFRHVCPMWSSFDSKDNYNRKVAVDTWTTSEPVFYALQAMSAACLADSMPQVQSILPSLVTQATATIKKKMSALRNSPDIPALSINIDLLFAVFAMGTSMHWADSSQYGDEMLQDAREALGILLTNLSAVDAMVHAYFHQALTYWEMMYSIVEREPPNNYKLDRKRLKYQKRLHQALQLNDHTQWIEQPQYESINGDTRFSIDQEQNPVAAQWGTKNLPHSWCGVSSEVIDVFGQVLALCRCARIRHRGCKAWTTAATTDALSDIGAAHDLQKELLSMHFSDISDKDKLRGVRLQTSDETTPISHLVHIAEAYREASLVQLYLTFEDLEVERSTKAPDSITSTSTSLPFAEDVPRAEKLVAMALELVAILGQVPAESGSRCIHPPLLILAAAGLRLNVNSCYPKVSTDFGQQNLYGTDGLGALQSRNLTDNVYRQSCELTLTGMSMPPQGIHTPLSGTPAGDLNITLATLEVAKARQFIRGRLHILQTNLPPRPIKIALDLVNAIWAEYDCSSPGSDAHWLDVMNQTGLQTIFG